MTQKVLALIESTALGEPGAFSGVTRCCGGERRKKRRMAASSAPRATAARAGAAGAVDQVPRSLVKAPHARNRGARAAPGAYL